MDLITKYKLVKKSKEPYSNNRTIELFDKIDDAIRWAKKLYTENNGAYDTMVIECQYASAENLKKDFTYMSHYRWASYFDEI